MSSEKSKHIGSNFDDFLEEEVEKETKKRIEENKNLSEDSKENNS